ncbi:GH20728 [Drosophila grimshawi]|uniref:GH20728 n=1 Tax=Drosophila grimshawi TaxID=7222 RepID=B4J6Q3_DROGR|nr:GH20728 [Drosophila grimshawi]
MKPQVNEQNGSTQNGDIATDAASVAMDAAAIVPAASATAAEAAVAESAGAIVPAKSTQQLKLEMLNIGNGNSIALISGDAGT